MEVANENGEGGHDDDIHIDEEFSDGDESSDEFEALMRQVEENDPSLLRIYIGFVNALLNDSDLTRFGAIIGGNTHLEELAIDILDPNPNPNLRSPSEGGLNFFDGLALNRSIKKLSLSSSPFDSEQGAGMLPMFLPFFMFPMFLPFFQNNRAFEHLEISNSYYDPTHWLAPTLGQFDSLKEFHLEGKDPDITSDCYDLLQALQRHVGLEKLNITQIPVGGNGLETLANLLQNPRSNLTVLGLRRTRIGDEGANILLRGLNGNAKLKEVDLGFNPDITEAGWRAIFACFQMPTFSLEKLCLRGSHISDGTALALSSALRHNNSLKTLDLSHATVIGSDGGAGSSIIVNAAWRDLFVGLLQYPTCKLEILELDTCHGLNDDILQLLTNALAHNCTLRQLTLTDNPDVTAAGWEAFSTVLRNPTSALVELALSRNFINDHALISISNALVNNNNTRLRYLHLEDSANVTPMGWDALSTVLRNPTSALEKLYLSNSSINDHNVVSFVNALAGNISLRKLNLRGNNITATGWDVFDNLLCNTSSIMNTYHSNHTLDKLFYDEPLEQPGDMEVHIEYLLGINHNSSSISQAARFKIILSHFLGSVVDLQPFTAMHTSILPFATAWMAKGEFVGLSDKDDVFSIHRSCEYNLLYQFIRSMPMLLER